MGQIQERITARVVSLFWFFLFLSYGLQNIQILKYAWTIYGLYLTHQFFLHICVVLKETCHQFKGEVHTKTIQWDAFLESAKHFWSFKAKMQLSWTTEADGDVNKLGGKLASYSTGLPTLSSCTPTWPTDLERRHLHPRLGVEELALALQLHWRGEICILWWDLIKLLNILIMPMDLCFILFIFFSHLHAFKNKFPSVSVVFSQLQTPSHLPSAWGRADNNFIFISVTFSNRQQKYEEVKK